MKKFTLLLAVLSIFVLIFAACATQTPAPTPAEQEPAEAEPAPAEEQEPTEAEEPQVTQADLVFGMAVHANPAEDAFWAVVERGANHAADTYGIELKTGGSSDPVEQAQLVETFISDQVDGIIVSLANPDALEDAVTRAVEAGIPVITINSGANVWKDLGALTHVGQTEFIAGQGAGEELNERTDAEKVLCVIHEEGNIGLEARCDGLADTFNGEVESFNVATTGVREVQGTISTIQDKLIADDSVGAILTLNPIIATAALDAINAAGGDQQLATFDLSPDVLEAIEAGEMLFAVDQQQYLQGYLPVVFLYLNNTNLNTVGGGQPVLTGPGIVDQSTASGVIDLAEQGTR